CARAGRCRPFGVANPARLWPAGNTTCITSHHTASFCGYGREPGPGTAYLRGQRPQEDTMGIRVAVAGASGYAGGELLRLIAAHPDLELGPVTAGSSAGAPVTDLHPHLAGLAGRAFEPTEPGRLAAADLTFLALHHEESAALAARLPASTAVID